jgi:hypothetical protein
MYASHDPALAQSTLAGLNSAPRRARALTEAAIALCLQPHHKKRNCLTEKWKSTGKIEGNEALTSSCIIQLHLQ